MSRFLKEFGVLFFLLVSLVVAYGFFCDFFFRNEDYYDKLYKPAWILSQKDQKFDFAVLGSSRAYSAFDMNLLDSITGRSWINLGANGSGLAENYMAFHLFLKRNKVDKLLLQIDADVLAGQAHEKNKIHSYSFLPYWKDSVIRNVLTREIEPLSGPVVNLFPQIRYFYFNKYFSPKEVVRRLMIHKKAEDTLDRLLGAEPFDEKSLSIGRPIEKENRDALVDYEVNPYLTKIVELARENGVDILFFTAPIYYGKMDEVLSFSKKSGYEVLLPEANLQQDESLYSDTWHLNEKGRRIYTLHLAESLESVISLQ